MPKKRFQPEDIIGKFRHADILLGQGKKVAEVMKAVGVHRGARPPAPETLRCLRACLARFPP